MKKKHGIFTKSYRIGSFSIEKIALRVHFMDLVEKIASLRQNLICYRSNEERAYQIIKMMNLLSS